MYYKTACILLQAVFISALCMSETVNIFWMRRDIRLHDNHALFKALNAGSPVVPLFILDTDILSDLSRDDPRLNLIHQELKKLDDRLKSQGKSLFIRHGKPLGVFKQLLREFVVRAVFTNEDYEPYALERDRAVAELLMSHDVSFHAFKDQVIFSPDEVLKADGKPYLVYTPYMHAWRKRFSVTEMQDFPSEYHLQGLLNAKEEFPSLERFGYRTKAFPLSEPSLTENIVRQYAETRDFPAKEGTTRLSVHLRMGLVSIRQLVKKWFVLSDVYINELIWREFYMMILLHFPHVVTRSFKPLYDDIAWRNDTEEFRRWCSGETGFPIVDAGMRQLNETGYMHNRLRMITAGFLTKDLLIDWRWGEAYFAEKLLDYDLAANNGGWQWSAGSGCDAAPYFRVFNPDSQQKKFDPDFAFTRRWVPEYKTSSYPKPVVDHKFARLRALEVYGRALKPGR